MIPDIINKHYNQDKCTFIIIVFNAYNTYFIIKELFENTLDQEQKSDEKKTKEIKKKNN